MPPKAISYQFDYSSSGTPEQYGAVGDGLTDDWHAFMRAISNHRLVVVDPKKHYMVSKPIRLRHGTQLVGSKHELGGSIHGPITNYTIIDCVGQRDWTIQGLCLTGRAKESDRGIAPGIGICFGRVPTDPNDASNGAINQVRLYSIANHAIATFTGCQQIHIEECTIENCGGTAIHLEQVSDIRVKKNHINRTCGDGISLPSGGDSCYLFENTIVDPGLLPSRYYKRSRSHSAGIRIRTLGCIVSGNKIQNAYRSIVLDCKYESAEHRTRMMISSNHCEGLETAGGTPQACLMIQRASRVDITNNHFNANRLENTPGIPVWLGDLRAASFYADRFSGASSRIQWGRPNRRLQFAHCQFYLEGNSPKAWKHATALCASKGKTGYMSFHECVFDDQFVSAVTLKSRFQAKSIHFYGCSHIESNHVGRIAYPMAAGTKINRLHLEKSNDTSGCQFELKPGTTLTIDASQKSETQRFTVAELTQRGDTEIHIQPAILKHTFEPYRSTLTAERTLPERSYLIAHQRHSSLELLEFGNMKSSRFNRLHRRMGKGGTIKEIVEEKARRDR